ncbi:MAG: MFS transporter [Armatimonadetes bacterium]|nr:MFS transporter [Armatimonadota bacterium]MDW8121298.1 MFS transporter [Armatimonadota bacterium]
MGSIRMDGDDQRTELVAAPQWRHWTKNFWLGVLNGILFKVGITFTHPSTVLAVFLTKLTGSEIFAGLLTAVAGIGWFLPPMFVAGYVEGLRRKLPLYAHMAFWRAIGWLLMMACVVYLAPRSPIAAAICFLASYGLFTVSGGIGSLAFMDIFARTVPFRRRGIYWGARMFLGSVLGIAAGGLITVVLKGNRLLAFPYDYAFLMGCSFLCFAIAWLTFISIDEPEPLWTPRPRGVREQLEAMRELWSQRPDFRQLIFVRLLLDIGLIALPFYSTFAIQTLGAPPFLLGTFVIAETIGALIANVLWSFLADAKSNLFVLKLSIKLALLPSGWALLVAVAAPFFGSAVAVLFCVTYFFLAFSGTGIAISFTNYVLELAEDAHRPTYLALSSASESGMMLLPVLGGLLLQFAPHTVLFAIAFVGALFSVLTSRRLTPAFATF